MIGKTALALFREAIQSIGKLFVRPWCFSSDRTTVLSSSKGLGAGAVNRVGRWLPFGVRGGLLRSGRDMKCVCYFLVLTLSNMHTSFADDSTSKVREGIKLYSAEQYEEASKAFAAANESLEKAKSDRAAVAAFDEACALHRKGDLELARDRYLKAGLSQDKSIATSAHFNLGVIASDAAHKLAGEQPETVPVEKRKEVIGELTKSIDSYRHCLELDPKYVPARRNLELLRQWIKYYNDRWREVDLQKRRDETNLVQFLEYLVQAQLALKETTSSFKASTSPNAFAEIKRLQSDLRDEIPFLKDKIESELRPKDSDDKAGSASSKSAKVDEELEQGIALLNGWADEANSKMGAAEGLLSKRDGAAAAEKQKLAADQLDQIWDAVVPFHPLLIKELSEQTQIAKQLTPNVVNDGTKDEAAKEESAKEDGEKKEAVDESGQQPQSLVVNEKDWTELLVRQEIALRKTRFLVPKAESELAQVESQPKPEPDEASANDATGSDPAEVGDASMGTQPKIDPEAIKAGYQKAIELAPKAVQEMESAVKQLGKRDREQAASHAEEARRILQEIHDAQPKKPQQEQKNQDKQQDKNEPQEKKEGEQQNEGKEKEKQDSKDEQDKHDEKDKEKKEEKKSGEEDKKEKGKKEEQRPESKVSQNRIEEALRRVREREQEKRERDRELKARVMGRVPVDKDW